MPTQPQQILRFDLPPDEVGTYVHLLYQKDALERSFPYAQSKEEREELRDMLVEANLNMHQQIERFVINVVGLDNLQKSCIKVGPFIDTITNKLILTMEGEDDGTEEKGEDEAV